MADAASAVAAFRRVLKPGEEERALSQIATEPQQKRVMEQFRRAVERAPDVRTALREPRVLQVITMALLYAFGAHGIMTLNDFKALEGDRQHGVRSLPVTLGPDVAARVACTVMGMAQLLVIALLVIWGKPLHAGAVTLLLLGQFWAMATLLKDPKARAPWYNATGIAMYVSGMMITAVALRDMAALP